MNDYAYLRKSPAEKMDYSYAAYGGNQQLNNYFSARTNAVERLSAFILAHIEGLFGKMPVEKQIEFMFIDKVLNGSEFSAKARLKEGLPKDYLKILADIYVHYARDDRGFVTEAMLKLIFLSGIDSSVKKPDEADSFIDQLAKKYEVFQRIFSRYDNSCRKGSGDFNNMSNYSLLGILAAGIFTERKDLRYLNLLLKINDLVSGAKYEKYDLNSALFALISIKKEVAITKSLEE